jgi:hypothetical protein
MKIFGLVADFRMTGHPVRQKLQTNSCVASWKVLLSYGKTIKEQAKQRTAF